jgi:hypothetical protein|nr:MAG TPA: hypothetical protein [Caudoviricetes sp.]
MTLTPLDETKIIQNVKLDLEMESSKMKLAT